MYFNISWVFSMLFNYSYYNFSSLWRNHQKFPRLALKEKQNFNGIGPHNINIVSIIFGSLLGKGEAIIRKDGTCIIFNYKAMHLNYSFTLFNYLLAEGYCDQDSMNIGKTLGKKGKQYKTMSFRTWAYVSFDWIYEMWYKNNIKTVPSSISEYFTPLALATWVMNSGVKTPEGLSFTKSFTFLECELLVKALYCNFGLEAIIKNTGISDQYQIYILKSYVPYLRNQISDYIIPSMKYKLLFD